MKKERYEKSNVEIIVFSSEDVLCTTGGGNGSTSSKSNDLPFVGDG